MKSWPGDRVENPKVVRAEFAILLALQALALGLLVYTAFVPAAVTAHPGRLAADGCHNDRKNGGRHCHRGPNAGQATIAPRNGEVYYPNCDAARSAGAAPVRRGQPGYGTHLDGDGDGIGCD